MPSLPTLPADHVDKKSIEAVGIDAEAGPRSSPGMLDPSDIAEAEGSSLNSASDVLALQDLDPVMNMKMHLVNNVSRGTSCPSERTRWP